MFCPLHVHLKQQDQALLLALGSFVGPVTPIVQHMADRLKDLPLPMPERGEKGEE